MESKCGIYKVLFVINATIFSTYRFNFVILTAIYRLVSFYGNEIIKKREILITNIIEWIHLSHTKFSYPKLLRVSFCALRCRLIFNPIQDGEEQKGPLPVFPL